MALTTEDTAQMLAKYSTVIGAAASIVCSIKLIKLMKQEKKWRTYERIMLSLSIYDIFYALTAGLTTIPAPKIEHLYWAIGNKVTCQIQGFAIQLTAGSLVMSHVSLALYFLLIIKFNTSNNTILRNEKYFHGLPLLYGIVSATIPLTLDMYHYAGPFCWIAEHPAASCDYVEEDNDCDESSVVISTYNLRWYLFFGEVIFSILFVCVSMTFIYLSVRKVEKQNLRYDFVHSAYSSSRRSKLSQFEADSSSSALESSSTKIMSRYSCCFKQCISKFLCCCGLWGFGGSSSSSVDEDELRRREQVAKALRKSRRVGRQSLVYCGSLVIVFVPTLFYRCLEQKNGNILFVLMAIGNFTMVTQGVFDFINFQFRRRKDNKKAQKRRTRAPPHTSISGVKILGVTSPDENC